MSGQTNANVCILANLGEIAKRVERYTAKGSADECWLWTKQRHAFGYGRLKFGGFPLVVPRIVLALATGEIPIGKYALHSCDNPPCCNPAHLRWGTAKDNAEDMAARDRRVRWRGLRVGGGNPRALLTEKQVEAILRDRRRPTHIARDYGVSHTTVSHIRCGKAWPHVFKRMVHHVANDQQS